VAARLREMTADEDARVRYQLAFSLGELPSSRPRNLALASLARRDAADRWVRLAVLSSLAEGADEILGELAGDGKFRRAPAGREFLGQLALLIGTRGRQSEVAAVLRGVDALSGEEKALAGAMVRRLSEGLARGSSPLRKQLAGSARAREILGDLIATSRKLAADDKGPLKDRAEAVRTLALGAFTDVRGVLGGLLDSRHPQPLQLAAIETLSRFADADAAALLVSAWPRFSPRLRGAAAESLFSRPEWASAFLDAVERKKIVATDVDPARLKLLQTAASPKLRAQAARLAKLLNLGRRQDVLENYKPALALKGDAVKGKAVFAKVCAACHRVEGVGHEIGPNLAAMQNRGPESILLNVLDPNREVNPQYVNYVVTTTDGRSLTGMVAAETATSVTLKRGENQTDTVLRINIEEMRSTGLSLMPEGLEQQIDRQAMADLIAYLTALK
jgi:putative heme-binding domain-containing protein